jgi:hypothetical protein
MMTYTFVFGQPTPTDFPLPSSKGYGYDEGLSLTLQPVSRHVTLVYFRNDKKQIPVPKGFVLRDTNRHEQVETYFDAYYLVEGGRYELHFNSVRVLDMCPPNFKNTLLCNTYDHEAY